MRHSTTESPPPHHGERFAAAVLRVPLRSPIYSPLARTSLQGKHCLWVPTTGGDEEAYTPAGLHAQPFESFMPVIEQTARYCGMQWEPPYIVHGANGGGETRLAQHAALLVERLAPFRDMAALAASEARP